MLFFAIGGVPLALVYKAINTMDSMIGYKNEKYLFFGRAAARLDDIANFLPARLTARMLILAATAYGLDWRRAHRVYLRDRRAHSSPNAGHPESACAGALGIRLGGNSTYGGQVVEKPSLGDATRKIEPEDILRANRLLQGCAFLSFLLCCVVSILLRGVSWI
jgi:adenosylcobinamide-phosphate synthase